MKNELYEYKFSELRREIISRGARVKNIDEYVSDLLSINIKEERLARDLLSVLSDHAQYDEGMFSLIHAAESCPDRIYVKSLISVLPDLKVEAPRWSSIVLIRALNNDETRSELVRQLHSASNLEKEAVLAVCDRINNVDHRFLNKTLPVTLAARS